MTCIDNKNPADNEGFTPLYVAAQNGHYEVCQIILENVINKNPACHNGTTPFYMAAQNGHVDLCKLYGLFRKQKSCK